MGTPPPDRAAGSDIRYALDSDTFSCAVLPAVSDRPLSVCLPITRACGLDCYYCLACMHDITDFDLRQFAAVMRALKAWAPLRIVLTGGEPLSHPDIIPMLRVARDCGMIAIVSTNGAALTEMLPQLRGTVDWLDVSLPSLDANTYKAIRGGGELEPVLSGLEHAAEDGMRTRVSVTILKENRRDLLQIGRAARKLGARCVRYGYELPHTQGGRSVQYVELHELASIKAELESTTFGVIAPRTFSSIPDCRGFLLIAPNGDLYIRPYSTHKVVVGNALKGTALPELSSCIARQLRMFNLVPTAQRNHLKAPLRE